MIRLSHGLIVLAGAAALAGMMLTQPDYGRATRPFVSHAGAGDWAETRLFRARLDGWRSAERRNGGGAFKVVRSAVVIHIGVFCAQRGRPIQ